MIVVKGQPDNVKELDELTFVQKCEVFAKFHTTQALALFGSIYAFWQIVPDDLKADLFNELPWLAKYKTIIYVSALAVTFYQTKMGVQTIAVRPHADDVPAPMTKPPEQP